MLKCYKTTKINPVFKKGILLFNSKKATNVFNINTPPDDCKEKENTYMGELHLAVIRSWQKKGFIKKAKYNKINKLLKPW